MSKSASEFQKIFMSLTYRGKDIFKPMNTGMIDAYDESDDTKERALTNLLTKANN